jgi:hypothetical protein
MERFCAQRQLWQVCCIVLHRTLLDLLAQMLIVLGKMLC